MNAHIVDCPACCWRLLVVDPSEAARRLALHIEATHPDETPK